MRHVGQYREGQWVGVVEQDDPASSAPEFYQRHRGGGGLVVVVTAIHDETEENRTGIFGSIETAMIWRDGLGDKWTCVYAPYVVDDPDFGNRALT